jgi:hypothetical protein
MEDPNDLGVPEIFVLNNSKILLMFIFYMVRRMFKFSSLQSNFYIFLAIWSRLQSKK